MPNFNTITRSLIDITSRMSCSISSSVMPASRKRERDRRERRAFARVEPGGGFVDEQEPRLAPRSRARVRRAAGRRTARSLRERVGDRFEPQLARAFRARVRSLRVRRGVTRAARSRSAANELRSRAKRAGDDVFEHGHLAEQARVLKRAPDAERRDAMRLPARRRRCPRSRTVPAVSCPTPLIALNSVVLPAPLGPISDVNVPRSNAKLTSFDGDESAEAFRDAATASGAASFGGATRRARIVAAACRAASSGGALRRAANEPNDARRRRDHDDDDEQRRTRPRACSRTDGR